MNQFDADHTHFESRSAGDKSVAARFYVQPMKDEAESAKQGRPVFKDVDHIEIIAPGNQNNIIRRRVTSIDIERFPMLYERFKAGHADVIEGTPLSEVPWIGRSMVEELNYLHIRTLEQLANLDDAVCTRFVGYHELKRRAQAFVEKAQSDAPLLALEEENKNLKESMAALEQMVKQQTEAMAKLQEQVEKSGKK